jgi:hypothetical protein
MVFARSVRQLVQGNGAFHSQPCDQFAVSLSSPLGLECSNMCSLQKRLQRLTTGASVVLGCFDCCLAIEGLGRPFAEVDSRSHGARTSRDGDGVDGSCDETACPVIRSVLSRSRLETLAHTVRHGLSPTAPDPANQTAIQ